MEALFSKRKELIRQQTEIQKEIDKIEIEIKKAIQQQGVRCTSCGRFFLTKNIWKATQQDVDNYIDDKEGYAGPTGGEYYCGC